VWSRGVDSDLFSPTRRDALWRRAQGIADNEVIISFVGRLVKEKNTDLVSAVFQQLKARGVAFRPMVVGDGPELDAMRRAIPQGIFPGFLNGENLARAYASSDIFFFPSESETFGNVTLEAMASGLPAVNAVASGSNSLVVEGETGFLCDASRPDAFVERLASLAVDGGLRATMGAAARARALTFSWEHILSELVASYYRVLAEGPEARDSPPADDGRAGRS
jgi:glycosyltransferase involved in cell wall biosynthesis